MSQWSSKPLAVSQWACHEYFSEHVYAVENIIAFLQGRQSQIDALAFRLRVLTATRTLPPIETNASSWLKLLLFEASFTEKKLRTLSAHDKRTLQTDFPDADEFSRMINVPLFFYNAIILGLHEILRDRLSSVMKPDSSAASETIWWYLIYLSKKNALLSLLRPVLQKKTRSSESATATLEKRPALSVPDLIYIAIPEQTARLWQEHREIGYERWKKAVAFADVEHKIKNSLNLP